MTISEISIKNPVFAWMLMLGICFFGFLGFNSLGVSQMPDVEFPVLSIEARWEGAAPDIIETDVVDPIEDAIMGVQGLREISSTSFQGFAEISLEFDLDRDIDAALQDVQSKISSIQDNLPRDADAPVITKTSTEDMPIVWIGVTTKRPLRELMQYVDDNIKDRLKTVSGVGELMLGGYLDRNLRVWLDPEKLNTYELTAKDITDTIEKEHVEEPAGRLETADKEANIRVMGEAYTVEEFGNIVINNRASKPNYRPMKLKEVATIEDNLEDVRKIARSNGERAIGMGIKKQRGTNAVEVADRVKARVAEIKKDLPADFDIGVRFDSTKYIKDSVHELIVTLTLACLFTALVCWAFLGSISSTVNVLLSIPMSIMGTFFAMKFAGFTLNTFTLLALSLSVGIVVDDAIMVLENIVRHKEMGKSRIQAATDGATQIMFAATAASLSIIAIFLPVAFMEGIIGKFFFQYAVTISVAVGFSLLSALTISPAFSSRALTVGERTTVAGKFFEGALTATKTLYEKLLAQSLHNRKKLLAVVFIIFIVSLGGFKIVKKEFVPAQDQSIFLIRYKTPIGSSIAFTDDRIKQAEALLWARPELKGYFAAVGGFHGGQINSGMMFITMKEKKERPVDPVLKRRMSQEDFMNYCRTELNKIPGLTAMIQDLSTRGFSASRGYPIEFTIRGRDWNKLVEYSTKIQEEMKKDPYFNDVDSDYDEGMPEVRVYPDRDKALAYGVSVENITNTITTMLGGTRAGKYTQGGKRYDVRVKVVPEKSTKPEDITNLKVWNNRGEIVTLKDVVTAIEKNSLLSITRRDRERAIGIFANPGKGTALGDALDHANAIAARVLPEGYRCVFSGTSQTFKESFQSLIFAMWCGIIVTFMILASQFNHVIHPGVVLMALPFCLTGAVLAMLLGGQSLNIYSMIGLVLLFGIVLKNSILLVEFTNQLRHEGKSPMEALMIACPIRLRPILMTSFATIAGAIPSALALGAGAEVIRPMGVVIVGGVFVSTLLTLFVVPSVYLITAGWFEKKKK